MKDAAGGQLTRCSEQHPGPTGAQDAPLFPGRVGLQQRVLPSYRVPYFDHLAQTCSGGLGVFAGDPRPDESILSGAVLQVAAYTPAHNRHLLRGRAYLCRQPGILAWLDAWDPDVLILEANPRYPDNRRAQRWMRQRGRPVIGWGLGAVPAAGLSGFLRRAARSSYLDGFDALIAYSSQGAALYRAAGFPAGRIFVAPNAVVSRTAAEKERPARQEAPVVLFVGRLQARKRVDSLIRCCARIEAPFRLWVVGDGPERSQLEALAAGILPQTQFFGAKQGEALEELFLAADLFVLPGTGGLAVQQAMAAGLAVIAAEGDGTQEDLVTEQSGWLLPAADDAALEAALRQALADRSLLAAMGEAGRQVVRHAVNVENMARVFHQAMCAVTGMEDPHAAGIHR